MFFSMIGLNYKKATIEIREKVSLTKSKIINALHLIHDKYNCGVVILSTCNRTEIYLSTQKQLTNAEIIKIYHEIVLISTPFYIKKDDELIKYLFELSCGMHSMILGEDQIITQVNDALELALEEHTTNSTINTLFRHSVTCAKKAKTDVNIKFISPSIVSQAINLAKKTISNLSSLNVLVIGNGQIGRLSAEMFLKEGCNVTMTLRTFKYKDTIVPNNCLAVNYDEKETFFSKTDIIVSATKSPHPTVYYKDIINLDTKPKYIFDLALPRDIEPTIKTIKNIECFDVDDIGKDTSYYDIEAINQIKKIIEKQITKFNTWYEFYSTLNNKNKEGVLIG